MPNKWDVFLSYSSKDRNVCKVILEDLERLGFRCWHDESRVGAGMRIREVIEDGIRHSACVVVLFSVHSLRSRWVLNELDAAMLREIRERRTLVIPVLIGRVKADALPADLQGKHFVDLRQNFEARYKNGKELLFKSIQLVTPRNKAIRRLTLLGPAAMSFFFSRKYRAKDIGIIAARWWDALMDILLKKASKGDEFESLAFSLFKARYGIEGFRRLLMFVFDLKSISLRGGFTEFQFDDALHEAYWVILMMTVHEQAMAAGYKGIELQVTKKRAFTYRIVKLTDF